MFRFQSSLNIAALVLIFIALVIPNRISAINASSFLVIPLELLVIGLLFLLPGRVGMAVRWVAAVLLAVGVIFTCADMATFKVFARPFNPLFDGYLLVNGMNLLDGTIGRAGALVIAVLLLFVVLLIVLGAFWILGRVRQLLLVSVRTSAVVLAVGLVLWVLFFFVGSPFAAMKFYQHLSAHTHDMLTTAADMKLFRAQLDKSDDSVRADENVLALLRDKNVLVIFVESYGRTVLDNPEFAPHIRPLLARTSEELAKKGFAVRSGFLTSPTLGGLSWLAHGTAMSGLWIDNQIRYNSLMMSERPTLNRVFNTAGWRTVAVMPAITMDWPEGNYYGYDQIYDAHNFGYAGKPFNWVTMPDQYTLAAFHARELATQSSSATPTPVMAEIALISSHAPWTPIPQLIDWNAVGDGTVFNAQAISGDNPEDVWRETARIRLQFRLAIEYALETIASYVVNYGDDNMVVLVLGDHQPAPIVTGETGDIKRVNRDVPIHLITRDSALINAVAHWQWSSGMVPAADAPVWPMNELRNKFIEAFSLPEH